jgi:hypothetical protein
MKRILVGVVATVALALGMSAPASAATPNDHATCLGILAADVAGQPGTWANTVHATINQAKNFFGFPPGVSFSNSAHRHGTDTDCFD